MTKQDHDNVVRKSFARQVGLFSGDDSPFARRPTTANSWLEPLEPAMIALDVACGAGHVAEQIAPHVRQVIGVDLTPALLDLGARRMREAGIDNVLLQEGNAASLPFVDESFDLVFSRSALHHMADPERGVDEMARVCRPGGRVVISDMIPPSAEVRERFDEVHRLLDPSHNAVLLESELAALLEEKVGPLSYGETPDAFTIPLTIVVTETADHDAVMRALHDELDGGAATGFQPVRDGDDVVVSFRSTVVHATRTA